jgi:hypothetical protein
VKVLRVLLVALLSVWGSASAVTITASGIISLIAATRSGSATADWQAVSNTLAFDVQDGTNGNIHVDPVKLRTWLLNGYQQSQATHNSPCSMFRTNVDGCVPSWHSGLLVWGMRNYAFFSIEGSQYCVYFTRGTGSRESSCRDTSNANYSEWKTYWYSASDYQFKATDNIWRSENASYDSGGSTNIIASFDLPAYRNSLTAAYQEGITYYSGLGQFNVAALVTNGVTFGYTYTDGGAGNVCSVTPSDSTCTPTGGTGGTGGTGTTCGTATSNMTCYDKDTTSTCTVIDIICSLKYLFIPNKDHIKAMIDSKNLSKTLNIPIRPIDESIFSLCFFGGGGVSGDPNVHGYQPVLLNFCNTDGNTSGNKTFKIKWTDYTIPTAVYGLISFFLWLGVASYILNYLGLPNPFGRRMAPDQTTGRFVDTTTGEIIEKGRRL